MNKVPSTGDPALPGQDNPTPEFTAAVAAAVGDIFNCGEPATTRIEIYIPSETLGHHVLDGVSYYCDRHAGEILEVISWDTDDSIRVERTALTDQDKACGSGWDFTALNAETVELMVRLSHRLRDADRRERQAFASGYVQGVTARLTGTGHAFTVEADGTEADKFRWLCRCGWVTFQYPAGTDQTPIHKRLTDHVFAATAVDERTAKALEVDSCSCPREVPEKHAHCLYLRRMASTGKLTQVVVEARWMGQRLETLNWTLNERGLSQAAEWVHRHGAVWMESGARVEPGELARWLA